MKPIIKVIEINYLQDCCRKTLASSDAALVEAQLRWLLENYSLINYKLGYERPIWRGIKCNSPSGFQYLHELSYPPIEFTKAGRLNNQGNPVLYGAFNNFGALEEIGAKEGDYIHLVGYRIKKTKKLRCCVVGEVLNVHRSGQAWASVELGQQLNNILNKMSPAAGRSFVYIDAFFSSILRDKKAASNNYLHSRILGTLLLEKLPGLDAILYPSVALESSMNIAVIPDAVDSIFEVFGTTVVRVERKYDYGIFDFSIVRNAKGFGGELIDWG
jgi:hypothetical protein